jgi:hypothetical protein
VSYLSWGQPTANEHPRIWVTSAALVRSRISHTDMGEHWQTLQDYCNSALNKGTHPDAWFRTRDGEHVGALALSYLVDGNVRHGRRAIEVCEYLASLNMPPGEDKQKVALSLALTYDWAFGLLTATQKVAFRNRLSDYVRHLREVRDDDHLWGVCQGNVAAAIICLIAIMHDSSTAAENTDWRTWMGEAMDELDDGTNGSYLPAHRWYGNDDGGTFTGSPTSRLLEWYVRLFPALSTGVGWSWSSHDEDWYENLVHWTLWHLRMENGSASMHRQHEVERDHALDRVIAAHGFQVASALSTTLGKNAAWLADLVNEVGDEAVDGAYEVWTVLWKHLSRASERPEAGDVQMRTFSRAGKVCFRDGWEALSTSLTVSAGGNFTGSRQHRDGGAIELAAGGVPILVSHGHLQRSQVRVPRVSGDIDETGHRWTYQARVISKSAVAVRSSAEASSSPLTSRRGLTADTAFGNEVGGVVTPSEVGDQAWPKSAANDKDRPSSLAAILDESTWQRDCIAYSEESEGFAYAVLNLTPLYWEGKVTRYRRHVLWVKAGQVPGWYYPVVLVWDDLVAEVDPAHGAGTIVYMLQSRVRPTGSAADLTFEDGNGKLQHAVANPAVTHQCVAGFQDFDGYEYPAIDLDGASDSIDPDGEEAAWRTEVRPTSEDGSPDLVSVLFPCEAATGAHPEVSLIDDGTWVGATVGGVDCKVLRGNTFQASIAGTAGESGTTSTGTTSASTSASTSVSSSTTSTAPTSPPTLAVVSPPRMPQKNVTIDKMASRLNLAGSGELSPILAGLAATFSLTLQPGEELQRWRIYSDGGFSKELTWVLYPDGDEEVAERSLAQTSVQFGRDTDTGTSATRNYIEWTTNFGVARRQFYVKDPPAEGGFYYGGQLCHNAEVEFLIAAGSDLTLGINILPGWADEFGIQATYSYNCYANTLRCWGGAFTAEVFMDGAVVISERDIGDVSSWYWDNPTEGLHEMRVRLRAMAGSEYFVDFDGSVRITYGEA